MPFLFILILWPPPLLTSLMPIQNLEDLEKEEELKVKAGEYETDEESEDEEMQEIRQLAKQIREKRKLKIVCSKDKDVHGPRLPRTVKKVTWTSCLYA